MTFERHESNEEQSIPLRNKLILEAIDMYYTKEKLEQAHNFMQLEMKKLTLEVNFITEDMEASNYRAMKNNTAASYIKADGLKWN